MKYEIHVFNSEPNNEGYEYICTCQPSDSHGGLVHVCEVRLKSKDQLRETLSGLISEADIESTIKTLAIRQSEVLDFPNIELTDGQKARFGC